MLKVQLEIDNRTYKLNTDLVACLADEPKAKTFFDKLPPSHQNYFSKWIESAKTEQTRTKRIAQTINAMSRGFGFSTMLKEEKKDKKLQ